MTMLGPKSIRRVAILHWAKTPGRASLRKVVRGYEERVARDWVRAA